MSREALLAAVAADPDADLPRLVFADWCDDHGEPDRAEFVRLQCRTARADPTDPGWLPTKLREYELFDRHRAEWMPSAADEIATHLAYRWLRGFPEWAPLCTSASGLNGRYCVGTAGQDGRHLAEAAQRSGTAPVRGLLVCDYGSGLDSGLRGEWCRTVCDVSLMGGYASCEVPQVDGLCHLLSTLPDGHWPSLRRLRLDGHPSDDGLDTLTDAPVAEGLTALSLSLGRHRGGQVSGRAVRRFARRHAPHLEGLALNSVTAEQAAALAAVRWPRLQRLSVNWVHRAAIARLADADLPLLADLTVGLWAQPAELLIASGLRDAATALARSHLVARLSALSLSGWPVESLSGFWSDYTGPPLARLAVHADHDSAYGPRLSDLSRLPAFQQLRTLCLSHTWGSLGALAGPNVLPELHSVRVADTTTRLPLVPLHWQGGERVVVAQTPSDRLRPDAYTWTAG